MKKTTCLHSDGDVRVVVSRDFDVYDNKIEYAGEISLIFEEIGKDAMGIDKWTRITTDEVDKRNVCRQIIMSMAAELLSPESEDVRAWLGLPID